VRNPHIADGNRQFLTRRDVMAMLGGAAVAVPAAVAEAQPTATVPRIGFLVPAAGPYINTPTAVFDSFRRGLADLGYIEGRNIHYEYRSAPNRASLGEMATELAGLKVDVLVAAGVAAYMAKAASASIPIVFGFSGDPIQAGLVDRFARPGHNMTGVTFLSTELAGKRLGLLKEAAPAISQVGVMAFPGHPGEQSEWRAWEDAARALGVSLQLFEMKNAADVDRTLTMVASGNVDAIHAFPDGVTAQSRVRIAEFALSRHLPSVFGWKEYAEAGGLMSYGPNLEDSWREIAGFVDKILTGARPADLPVEQPTRFELIVNLKTARTLGLTMPPTLLAAADEVIG
jgi:putative tryptophan/tyrosine transport system substrate-binding protein